MVAKTTTGKRGRPPKAAKPKGENSLLNYFSYEAKTGKSTKRGAAKEPATPTKAADMAEIPKARVGRKPVKPSPMKKDSPVKKTSPTSKVAKKSPIKKVNAKSPVKKKGGRVGRPPKASKDKVVPKIETDEDVENENQVEEFPCANCPRKFKSRAGLKRHENKCKPSKNARVSKSPSVDRSSMPRTVNGESGKDNSVDESGITVNNSYESSINLTCYCCGEDLATCHTIGDHMCNECGKMFTIESALERHKSTMHAELPEDQERKNNSDQQDDIIPELKDKPRINCFCCGEDLLTAHISGDYECAQCSKRFKLKCAIERHLKIIHGSGNASGIHECIQCGAKCPDKGTLARHMYTHTGLKPYSCPVCRQDFSRKYHLVRHNMQTGCDGSKKPIFPCQVCGREFNRKDNLREHLRAHAGQTKRTKMFSCDTCGMEFPGTNLLQVHKRTHTGGKPYWCDFCPKQFSSSGALKKHRRVHTGERPFECQICQKRFGAKETLNRHIRIHTGYKPHCCQYCGKRFIQSSQLKSHLFYHTGQSVLQPAVPVECELCGKKFNRRARLNEHTKFIHLGAKPFECQVETCSKTFIRKEDLNRHLLIHSGVKAHKCPICEKAFAMKSSLKVHLLTHTKEQPRSCDECGRAFIRQDCLLRHMRNKHRDMLEKIMSEAEKKKLQQQLLQMAAEANQLEGLEEKRELTVEALADSVRELLALLVDEVTLRGLGWPQASIHQILEAVIQRCGHEPALATDPSGIPTAEQLRHNVKLLFTVVIDDSAVKALLNNQTVDEVILHVLRLAKS